MRFRCFSSPSAAFFRFLSLPLICLPSSRLSRHADLFITRSLPYTLTSLLSSCFPIRACDSEELRTRRWGFSSPKSSQATAGDGKESPIRAEEVIIVLVIFVIWMSFIMLFIKKWGRIRTLEPQCFLPKELLNPAPDLLVVPTAVAAAAAASSAPAAASSLISAAGGGSSCSNARVNSPPAIIYNNINSSCHKSNNNHSAFAGLSTTSQRQQGLASSRFRDAGLAIASSVSNPCLMDVVVARSQVTRRSILCDTTKEASGFKRQIDVESIVTSGSRSFTRGRESDESQPIDRTLDVGDTHCRSNLYDLPNDPRCSSSIQGDRTAGESRHNLLKLSMKGWRRAVKSWHQQQQQSCGSEDQSTRDADHLLVGKQGLLRSTLSHEEAFRAANDKESDSDPLPLDGPRDPEGGEDDKVVSDEVVSGKIRGVHEQMR